MELVTAQATKAGFYGGIVVDYPNSTKAKKFFLVLMTGGNVALPKGLGTSGDAKTADYVERRDKARELKGKPLKNTRRWILEKKERRRKQGKETRRDSKYTGRKRSGKF